MAVDVFDLLSERSLATSEWDGKTDQDIFFLDLLHNPVCKEEVLPEEERSLLQEEPQPPHIKEEHDEQLQRTEEDGELMTVDI